MRVIEGTDVNELYWRGMNMLASEGREEPSRNGPVLVMDTPVTSVYKKPMQRVLLDPSRKANPFFHLFESLWMLAGRDDVAALNLYITDFGTRFAEADGRVHGAYGHRWRRALGFDQLDEIVKRLRSNPGDRQCVLQMWDARSGEHLHGLDVGIPDIGKNDLMGSWKDRPCNTQVYFRLKQQVAVDGLVGSFTSETGLWPVLDMIVTCRSNDIIFGAYGANAVHFSILHEYIASRVGATVGTMYQMSWNYHAYRDVFERIGPVPGLHTYQGYGLRTVPMVTEPNKWDTDLNNFFIWHTWLIERGTIETPHPYHNVWFHNVARPMFLAHWKWKQSMRDEAMKIGETIAAPDWRFAVRQWFNTRTEARSR